MLPYIHVPFKVVSLGLYTASSAIMPPIQKHFLKCTAWNVTSVPHSFAGNMKVSLNVPPYLIPFSVLGKEMSHSAKSGV